MRGFVASLHFVDSIYMSHCTMMKPGKMNCVIWILTIGEQEKRDKISHIAVLETQ